MRRRFWLCALLAATAPVDASELFGDDSVLELSIRGPFAELVKSEDREERKFVLSVDGQDLALKLRRRGKSRLRVCNFPPLRVNLARNQTTDTPLAGENKLKLATHCMDSDRHEQNLLEEYLAYRLFNSVTETSYRVRLARIRYVESDGRERTHRYAFFIERDTALAERIGATVASSPHVVRTAIDESHATLMYVFQYMIGNTDWSLARSDLDETCCHNVDLLARDERTLVIPYDFDLSGLVNAPYARPDPSIRIRSVRTRRYRGYCASTEHLVEAMRALVQLRDELLANVTAVPGLQPAQRENAAEYLAGFFDGLTPETDVIRKFERACL